MEYRRLGPRLDFRNGWRRLEYAPMKAAAPDAVVLSWEYFLSHRVAMHWFCLDWGIQKQADVIVNPFVYPTWNAKAGMSWIPTVLPKLPRAARTCRSRPDQFDVLVSGVF